MFGLLENVSFNIKGRDGFSRFFLEIIAIGFAGVEVTMVVIALFMKKERRIIIISPVNGEQRYPDRVITLNIIMLVAS